MMSNACIKNCNLHPTLRIFCLPDSKIRWGRAFHEYINLTVPMIHSSKVVSLTNVIRYSACTPLSQHVAIKSTQYNEALVRTVFEVLLIRNSKISSEIP